MTQPQTPSDLPSQRTIDRETTNLRAARTLTFRPLRYHRPVAASATITGDFA